jgi:putrescine aminotransferase
MSYLDTATDVFESLRRHVANGTVLGAKVTGQGAVESRSEGAIVHLSDGEEAIDFGSYAVTLIGHRHPAVVAAVTEQLEYMASTTRTLANPTQAAFMDDLSARLPEYLHRIWLGSDGSDAVEVAIKLARRQTGRLRVLAVVGGFHGKTLGSLALTYNPIFRKGLEPLLQQVTHIQADDADAVARETAVGDVAALVVEPIQGEGGVRSVDEELLRRWAADAQAAGAFFISDEVQVGLRRCGGHSLAVEANTKPDAVLFGKALGGGVMPLAAMVATDELYAPMAADPTYHTQTFSGHPLSCAAGRAALATIDELAPVAKSISDQLGTGLRALAREHPESVVEVRGRGLLWGLEFVNPGVTGSVMADLAMRHVLISPCLSASTTIRLSPPMVTTPGQVDRVLTALAEVLTLAASFVDQ